MTENKTINMQEVIDEVAVTLSLDKSKITYDANLITDLGLGSLEILELISYVETKFEIQIAEEDLRNFGTINDIIKYLNRRGFSVA